MADTKDRLANRKYGGAISRQRVGLFDHCAPSKTTKAVVGTVNNIT
jgi:hypothetical protein